MEAVTLAKDPAFLFYPNDYMGGTMGMTFEEKGAYMELLMLQFNRGHMTSHMIGQTVGQLWENIKCKFKVDDDGLFYNARLEEEVKKRKNFVKSRHNNISGKNQHSQNEGHTPSHMDGHVTSHMENENDNEDLDNRELKVAGKGVKGENPDKPKKRGFTPPALEEIKAYCKERGNDVDPKKFYDYFTAAEWVDSRGNPVKNWKQKVITWESDERRVPNGQRTGNNQSAAGADAARDWNLTGITEL